MTKRIISLILTFVIVSALFMLNVNAATAGYIFASDFEGIDIIANPASVTADNNWTIGNIHNLNHSSNPPTDSSQSYAKIADGVLEIMTQPVAKPESEGGGYYATAIAARYFISEIPNNYSIMFDICRIEGQNLTFAPRLGPYMPSWTTLPGYSSLESGTWYTYCLYVTGSKIDVYKKLQSDTGNFDSGDFVGTSTMNPSSAPNDKYFYFYSINGTAVQHVKFDNIKMITGTTVDLEKCSVEVTDKIEGETVTGKYVTANATVISNDASPSSSLSVLPVFVIFDKKGKIMDMTAVPQTLSYGENNEYPFSIEYTLLQYEAIKGGTAELYLWDSLNSLKPMMTGYRVNL